MGSESYNPRVRKLIEKWVEHMRTEGEVWTLYPFNGIFHSLLANQSSKLRCGAGWRVFAMFKLTGTLHRAL